MPCWNVWRWNFDVGHVDVIIMYNVEHEVQSQGCPFDATVLKRKPTGGGSVPMRLEIWLFEEVQVDKFR